MWLIVWRERERNDEDVNIFPILTIEFHRRSQGEHGKHSHTQKDPREF